jgi:hypothetical protein
MERPVLGRELRNTELTNIVNSSRSRRRRIQSVPQREPHTSPLQRLTA